MSLDVNTLRIAVLVVSFAAFIVLVSRVWSRSQQGAQAAAAELPFVDEQGATRE